MSEFQPGAYDPEVLEETSCAVAEEPRLRRQPPYHVLLHDDDDHTYDYVVDMLRKLFGYTVEGAYRLAVEVDTGGRAIIDTTTLERAELKRDQIHAYGKDWRLGRSAGSMTSTIEPASEC